MRNLIPVFFLFVLLQSCKTTGDISAKTGIGMAKMVGEPSYEDPLGAQVSIEAKIAEISKQSELSAGIGYSLQGAKYKEGDLSGKLKVGYINIPLLYTYQAKKGFYAEAGLQPGFLISAKDKYNGETHDYKYGMKKFELGLPVGMGYKTINGLGIGLRVIPGLTKNQDDNSRNLLMLVVLSYQIRGVHER